MGSYTYSMSVWFEIKVPGHLGTDPTRKAFEMVCGEGKIGCVHEGSFLRAKFPAPHSLSNTWQAGYVGHL